MHKALDIEEAKLRTSQKSEIQSTTRLNTFKWSKNLTKWALYATFYQITISLINFYYWNSSFHTILLIQDIMTIFAILLTYSLLKQTEMVYSSNTIPRNIEDSPKHILTFILSLMISIVKVMILVNMVAQSGYTNDYIEAMSSNEGTWNSNYSKINHGPLITSINILNMLYSFLVFYLAIYFIYNSKILFRLLQKKDDAMSFGIYIINLLFVFCGVSALWHDYILKSLDIDRDDNSKIDSELTKMILPLTIALVMSVLIWSTNYYRNRCTYFLMFVVIIGVVGYIGSYAHFTYSQQRSVYITHKEVEWQNSMYKIHQQELEQRGCPMKYIDTCNTEKGIMFNVWENESTEMNKESLPAQTQPTNGDNVTPKNSKCLNVQCSGIVGQIYASEYLKLSNYIMACLLYLVVIWCGFYYFWVTEASFFYKPKKSEAWWLIALFGFAVVCCLRYYFSTMPQIVMNNELRMQRVSE